MKKLVLLCMLMMSSVFGDMGESIHFVKKYKNVPRYCFNKNKDALAVMTWAACAALWTLYNFEELSISEDETIIVAYNNECAFYMYLTERDHECIIEFIADNYNYSYFKFEGIMDFFLQSD